MISGISSTESRLEKAAGDNGFDVELGREGDWLAYWEGRCAVTGLAILALLRASHIKRWADCETDAEGLDVFWRGAVSARHSERAKEAK